MENNSHVEMPYEKDACMPCNLESPNNDKVNDQELEKQRVDDEVEIPKIGMPFEFEEEVRNYFKNYAKHQGFGVTKKSEKNRSDGKSSYFSLVYSQNGNTISKVKDPFHPRPSSKTNCKAKFNVIAKDDGRFIISGVYLDHNHALKLGKARHYRCSGYENLPSGERECRNYIAKVRQLRLGIGDAETLLNYFRRMQNRNPNFFYMIDTDEEGCLRNVFWADARCRATYEYFGDVISFDTTYLTNKFDMPSAPFVGVNHHGKSILFGCGLLSNEDIDTYIWLFESWLTCMSSCAPKAIITDQCKAIQAVVAKMFPKSSH